jgi:hypothetical protein
MNAAVEWVSVATRHKLLVMISPQIYVVLGRLSVLVFAKDSKIVSARNLQYRSLCSGDRWVPLRLLHLDSASVPCLYVLLEREPMLETLVKLTMTNQIHQAIEAASICERALKMLSKSWLLA